MTLPRSNGPVPQLSKRRSDSLRSLADYRYHNDRVKYERLADKGLRYDQVASPTADPTRPSASGCSVLRRAEAGQGGHGPTSNE